MQNLLVNNFEWIEDTSQFNENFKKTISEESEKGHFFEIDVEYTGKLNQLQNHLPFSLNKINAEKVKKFHDKTK